MRFSDIKPFIRFASTFDYKPEGARMVAYDCRLIYIRSGNCELLIGEKSRNIGAGALVYCRSGIPYAFFSDNVIDAVAINFDMDMRRSKLSSAMQKVPVETYEDDGYFEEIEDAEPLNSFLVLEKATRYERLVERIADEFRCRKPYYSEKVSGLLESLLADLLRENLSSKNREINEVIEYINVNFRQRLTNEALAEMAGYHPLHLNRLFKREVGTTVHNYVLRLRIAEAARLLLSTNMAISDIADAVGFDNATHFSTQFKKSEDCSPLEYRKKYKGVV